MRGVFRSCTGSKGKVIFLVRVKATAAAGATERDDGVVKKNAVIMVTRVFRDSRKPRQRSNEFCGVAARVVERNALLEIQRNNKGIIRGYPIIATQAPFAFGDYIGLGLHPAFGRVDQRNGAQHEK